MKGAKILEQVKNAIVCLVPLIALSLISAVRGEALDTSIELAAGYDDNVTSASAETGSGFTFYRTELAQQFFSDHPSIDSSIFVEGAYRDYFRVSDRYELKAGLSFDFSLMNGRLVPGLISEGLIYRDEFMEEDDCDEIMVGGRIKWSFSERVTLEVRQDWYWTDYSEPVVIEHDPGPPDPGPGPGPGPGPMDPGHHGRMADDPPSLQETVDLNERIRSTGVQLVVYLTPSVQADLLAEYDRMTSSIDADEYSENSLSLSLLWTPSDLWEISAMTGWEDIDYDHDPDNIDQTETAYNANLRISRFIEPFELFFKVEWTENDSPFDDGSYRQTVTQCGVILSF